MTGLVIWARAPAPVMGSCLGAGQAPAGGEADLPQRGQIGQPFADPEVAGAW
jgi:hypothetical protein